MDWILRFFWDAPLSYTRSKITSIVTTPSNRIFKIIMQHHFQIQSLIVKLIQNSRFLLEEILVDDICQKDQKICMAILNG